MSNLGYNNGEIGEGNMLLRGGRCYQQYVVDMYVKLENTRLDFYRKYQDTIRAELYKGLLDTVEAGESSAANVGRRIVLPANYIGGPRNMKKRYLNSMSLVQCYGKPDLFVTMTSNANWPEIKRELGVGEEAQNRPDIVARAFRAKLLSLNKLIMEEHIFGEVAAFIYVVEFQKRGLPHAHFLIILKPPYKIHNQSDFDKFVYAEIPNEQSGALRASVLKHMMHGPCGKLDPTCACMKQNKTKHRCKYGYPKQFTLETTSNYDGYPEYRRRNTGDNAQIRQHTLDNRWVIPYNPYLMSLFDCHSNVEVCSTIQAVKYLYKYVYKGHDRVSFNITQTDGPQVIDEREQFQSGRLVSPCEAMWRIYGFDLYEMHPAVMPLQIHLSNMQTIQMRASENLEDVISSEKRSRTPLTQYFSIYKADVHGKLPKYLNSEFLSLTDGILKKELELRKVDDFQCETFQEAALKLRLLEPENTVEMCLDEAVAVQMPVGLRQLFETIFIFCQPKDPCKL
ncbi:uncharacterized protein LOC141629021 [Silene latifolia]|uniref:uncharacterized protein LOC141629021 n=1 Tax=Silene latifolia TaxID=37657 RepID=UPI003D777307